jgi:predicted ribosome quality control (RQC) complex YloA/Tae2 family protein
MSLSTAEIKAVVADLHEMLEGGNIARIDQPDTHELVFHVHKRGKRFWLKFVTHPRFSRLHLLTHRPSEKKSTGGFCNVLRQHLTGAPLLKLEQISEDRIVSIGSQRRNTLLQTTPVTLIAELVGAGSNLILIDSNNMVLGALFTEDSPRRRLTPGSKYIPLPSPPQKQSRSGHNRFAEYCGRSDPLALSRAIESYYEELQYQEEFENKRKSLLANIDKCLQRKEDKLVSLEQNLAEARRAERVRKDGELLKIALPELKKGQRTISVTDFFEPDNLSREIELDPSLTPQENISRYFSYYKKLKNSRKHILNELQQTQAERKKAGEWRDEVEQADTLEALLDLEKIAEKAGLLLPPVRKKREQHIPRKSEPRKFLSEDGFEILVARNQKQSHELTFTISRGSDYWMHLLGWPGPHVIIRTPGNQTVSQATLLDAAHLAIYYSKVRGTSFAQVVYTRRKHVNPIRGEGPGKVRYSNESTLAVRFSRTRMEKIFERNSKNS